jgi:hypothetical protein
LVDCRRRPELGGDSLGHAFCDSLPLETILILIASRVVAGLVEAAASAVAIVRAIGISLPRKANRWKVRAVVPFTIA